jgi:hypothetical protein
MTWRCVCLRAPTASSSSNSCSSAWPNASHCLSSWLLSPAERTSTRTLTNWSNYWCKRVRVNPLSKNFSMSVNPAGLHWERRGRNKRAELLKTGDRDSYLRTHLTKKRGQRTSSGSMTLSNVGSPYQTRELSQRLKRSCSRQLNRGKN